MKTFADKAYKHTYIDASTTELKINGMLEELGISQMRVTRAASNYVVEFIVKMYEGEASRKVRINVPLQEIGEKRGKQERDAMFRILYYNLKNRFVSVANGLREFEEEFLSDLVVMVDGQEQRVGDIIAPKYKKMLRDNKTPVFHITSGK